MCLFVETIRIAHGEIKNLYYHEVRMNNTRRMIWKQEEPIHLLPIIQNYLSLNNIGFNGSEVLKFRVIYGCGGIVQITCEPYVPKIIHSLCLVEDNNISYEYKSIDRNALQKLYTRRGAADDIIIVKDDMLTDTSFCNIALYNGLQWVTPKIPLLKGTMRSFLLDKGIITEGNVAITDIQSYSHIALFNAMIAFGQIVLKTSYISENDTRC